MNPCVCFEADKSREFLRHQVHIYMPAGALLEKGFIRTFVKVCNSPSSLLFVDSDLEVISITNGPRAQATFQMMEMDRT